MMVVYWFACWVAIGSIPAECNLCHDNPVFDLV